jgi:hypothetical protein
MPSTALIQFQSQGDKAWHLYEMSGDSRLRPITRERRQIVCHAALAGLTAAWNAFLPRIIAESHSVLANPLDVRYNFIYDLFQKLATRPLESFNTPNWENSRTLLITCTGHDPTPDWAWPQRNLNAVDVHYRLNEILKVRHSFAHGFPIPHFSWTASSGGQVDLTRDSIAMSRAFFRHLAKQTDFSLARHLTGILGGSPW